MTNRSVHGFGKWQISWPMNRVYHLQKSNPLTEKRPRKPDTGIKDGFKQTEHKFTFGAFRLEIYVNGKQSLSHFRLNSDDGVISRQTVVALFASHKPANFRRRQITCFKGISTT